MCVRVQQCTFAYVHQIVALVFSSRIAVFYCTAFAVLDSALITKTARSAEKQQEFRFSFRLFTFNRFAKLKKEESEWKNKANTRFYEPIKRETRLLGLMYRIHNCNMQLISIEIWYTLAHGFIKAGPLKRETDWRWKCCKAFFCRRLMQVRLCVWVFVNEPTSEKKIDSFFCRCSQQQTVNKNATLCTITKEVLFKKNDG